MGTDRQDNFGSEILLKALYEGQRDLHNKVDNLHAFISEHMAKEEEERLKMSVHLARLDEKVSAQGARWGIVSTVVTSVLSALGVSFFVGHR